ncbi:uncharacterized protein N7482_000210 [Penicillium canariense]|uniref:NACHT domain-containing protein n=1 Tax=Penicillium canariense TaxID=189055 RepID=A0A9W9LRT9_9EURO|nr:uncharacterized protein N7482_000210 [Penicillium canariense]KAJ5174333.1 hypothetical protein N7482_000210 [Penicillium canariense]
MNSRSSIWFGTRSYAASRLPAQPASTDPWEQALALYVNGLGPSKRQQFQAPATVDECLQTVVLNGGRRRAFTRILEFLRPLIDPLRRFEGAIDVVVQVSAGIASPIWGPLRVAITHLATLEQLVVILDKIAQSTQRYENLKTLFADHEGVRDAMGRLYCELLRLCACISTYETSRIRYIMNPFGKEFATVGTAIDQRAIEIDRAAQAAHFQESKAARDRLLAETREQNIRRLQCWLAPARVEDDLQRLSGYRDGSCAWILQADEFRQWYGPSSDEHGAADISSLGGPLNTALQVIGRPGSGKSMMAAYLIRYLSQCGTTLYFLFNKQDSERHSMLHASRTILAQLIHVHPELTENILLAYKNSGRVVADSLVEVMSMLGQVFSQLPRQPGSPSYYIVFDGIDECKDWSSSQYHFRTSLPPEAPVKIVLLGRVSPTFSSPDPVSPHPLAITMQPSKAVEHIRAYAEARIQEMTHLANTDLGTQAVRKTVEQADGLWLYARLLLDEMERAPSREVVQACLDSLPNGLEELYNHILWTSEAKMTRPEKEFARYLFLCADISNYMPDFLAQAMDSIQRGMLDLVFRFVNGGNMPFDAPGLAEKLGAPLIEVLRPTPLTYELRFVHLSVYQYLADPSRYAKAGDLPELVQTRQARDLYRGAMAVWYFTDCPDSMLHLEALRSNDSSLLATEWPDSYFPMTYCLWDALKARHNYLLCLSEPLFQEAEKMLDVLTHFLSTDRCLRWFETATIINYAGNFQQLQENILSALDVARREKGTGGGLRALYNFNRARFNFLQHWKAIVQITTPWEIRPELSRGSWGDETEMLPGFFEHGLGEGMLQIAREWSAKLEIAHKMPRGGRAGSPMAQALCPKCSAVMTQRDLEKHRIVGCRRNRRMW